MRTQSKSEIENLILDFQQIIHLEDLIIPGKDFIKAFPKGSILEKMGDLGYSWYYTMSDSYDYLEVFDYHKMFGFILNSKTTAKLKDLTRVTVNFYVADRLVTKYVIPVMY